MASYPFDLQDIIDEYRRLLISQHGDKVAILAVNATAVNLYSQCHLSEFSQVYFGYLMKAICRVVRQGQVQASRPFAALVSSHAFVEQAPLTGKVPVWNACMTDSSAHFHIRIPRPYKIFAKPASSTQICPPSPMEKKAVFRGSLSAFDRVSLFNRSFHQLDACVTKVPHGAPCPSDRAKWCSGAPIRWLNKFNIPTCARLSLAEQLRRYRLLLSVDGVGCADRLENLFQCGACIVKQNSPLKEYWYKHLQPNWHYREAEKELGNIETVVNQTLNCSLLRQNAKLLADKYLTPEQHLRFLARTINAYRKPFWDKWSELGHIRLKSELVC